jgi:hypothetical protein
MWLSIAGKEGSSHFLERINPSCAGKILFEG